MGLFRKDKKVESSCCCEGVENLIVKENQETKEQSGCSCGGSCNCEAQKPEGEEKSVDGQKPVIKILGSGCKNCITLGENVKAALEEMKVTAELVKVTDFGEITRYGVMSTPALVVNEKVVSYGKVLKTQEAVKLLEKALA